MAITNKTLFGYALRTPEKVDYLILGVMLAMYAALNVFGMWVGVQDSFHWSGALILSVAALFNACYIRSLPQQRALVVLVLSSLVFGTVYAGLYSLFH